MSDAWKNERDKLLNEASQAFYNVYVRSVIPAVKAGREGDGAVKNAVPDYIVARTDALAKITAFYTAYDEFGEARPQRQIRAVEQGQDRLLAEEIEQMAGFSLSQAQDAAVRKAAYNAAVIDGKLNDAKERMFFLALSDASDKLETAYRGHEAQATKGFLDMIKRTKSNGGPAQQER